MKTREAERALNIVRKMLDAWCENYNASARLEVCYHADMDDDDSDGE